MSRPFINSQIDELEAAFDSNRVDLAFLQTLVDELSHRKNMRAAQLRARAMQALGTARKPRNPQPTPAAGRDDRGQERSQPAPSGPQASTCASTLSSQAEAVERMSAAPRSAPPVNNSPVSVLLAWTALEVLTPPSFRRPEDLAGGDRNAVARLDSDELPWEGAGQKARPGTRLYYQIVLGTVDLEAAVTRLAALFADTRAERPVARGEAVLAVILVDREGRPVAPSAAAVSSFGWGVPCALTGELEVFAAWKSAEQSLVDGLDKLIRRDDGDGKSRPLDKALIRDAFGWLVSAIRFPMDLVT